MVPDSITTEFLIVHRNRILPGTCGAKTSTMGGGACSWTRRFFGDMGLTTSGNPSDSTNPKTVQNGWIFLEPQGPLFLKVNPPPQTRPFFPNQNRCLLGSRLV